MLQISMFFFYYCGNHLWIEGMDELLGLKKYRLNPGGKHFSIDQTPNTFCKRLVYYSPLL